MTPASALTPPYYTPIFIGDPPLGFPPLPSSFPRSHSSISGSPNWSPTACIPSLPASPSDSDSVNGIIQAFGSPPWLKQLAELHPNLRCRDDLLAVLRQELDRLESRTLMSRRERRHWEAFKRNVTTDKIKAEEPLEQAVRRKALEKSIYQKAQTTLLGPALSQTHDHDSGLLHNYRSSTPYDTKGIRGNSKEFKPEEYAKPNVLHRKKSPTRRCLHYQGGSDARADNDHELDQDDQSIPQANKPRGRGLHRFQPATRESDLEISCPGESDSEMAHEQHSHPSHHRLIQEDCEIIPTELTKKKLLTEQVLQRRAVADADADEMVPHQRDKRSHQNKEYERGRCSKRNELGSVEASELTGHSGRGASSATNAIGTTGIYQCANCSNSSDSKQALFNEVHAPWIQKRRAFFHRRLMNVVEKSTRAQTPSLLEETLEKIYTESKKHRLDSDGQEAAEQDRTIQMIDKVYGLAKRYLALVKYEVPNASRAFRNTSLNIFQSHHRREEQRTEGTWRVKRTKEAVSEHTRKEDETYDHILANLAADHSRIMDILEEGSEVDLNVWLKQVWDQLAQVELVNIAEKKNWPLGAPCILL